MVEVYENSLRYIYILEQEIDGSVLLDMTVQEFLVIGILMGPAKKLGVYIENEKKVLVHI